jgi:hypothetical protein
VCVCVCVGCLGWTAFDAIFASFVLFENVRAVVIRVQCAVSYCHSMQCGKSAH